MSQLSAEARRQIQTIASDCSRISHARGVALVSLHVVALNAFLVFMFLRESWAGFVAAAFVTAVYYTAVLITTHDAIHGTLTGWYWADRIIPRCFSYFLLWPHGLYEELHRLHHRLNGRSLEDPENPTGTKAGYAAGNAVTRFYRRHQWWLSLFVLGGAGMVLKHFVEARRWWTRSSAVRRAFWTDLAGIAACGVVTMSVVVAFDATARFLTYMLILERVVGCLMQMRSHVEHYGLWHDTPSLLEARLYSCRNVKTNAFGYNLFNGLNFHSVHHAFPRIPYYRLREAHARIDAVCRAAGRELPAAPGYFATVLDLAARAPILLDQDVATGTRGADATEKDEAEAS
jgi:fatty acid desaturase